ANGSFTYTPTANYNGSDTFTYKANDGKADSAAATVTITVTAVGDVPTAVADSYSVNVDGTLTTTTTNGVLANDTSPDGGTMTATVVTQPSHGTLTLNTNGTFSYKPTSGYRGSDTFTYKAAVGTAASTAATVTIKVNGSPTAVNNTYTVGEDAVLNVAATNGVLANDTDPDGDTLTAAVVTQPSHGTLTLNANGSFTYTPAANYQGTDTFTYKATDGKADSAAATVTITVTAVNDAPVALADSYSVNVDGTLTTTTTNGVLANDTDSDSTSITATVVTQPAHGTLTLNANGTFTYTPTAGYRGTDTFTYRATDGITPSAAATVTIKVNAAPVVVNNTYTVNEDASLVINPANGVLLNDTDPDGDAMTATVVTQPSHGTLTFNSNGSFTYTPAANFSGTDTFTYKATDGKADSAAATVTINVTAVNDVPVAVDDPYTVDEDAVLTVNAAAGVLANDTDADGAAGLAVSVVVHPGHGTVTLNTDGSFTYTPTANFSGIDTFTYRVNDGTANSSPATVTINVNAVNDVPVAVADSYQVDEDGTLTTTVANGVLANDTDAEGTALTAQVVDQPTHGTLAFNANGTFTYTPAADFHGTDTFTYRTSDGSGQSQTVTATIIVNPVNDVPVVTGDSYSATANTVLTVNAITGVLANDHDADGNPLTVTLVTGPAHGTLLVEGDGSFTYTPTTDYTGPDSFTYTLNDGNVESAIATVNLSVAAADQALAQQDEWLI
ncbi:MAG: Ig-like domain-containing protein, partial [Thermoguttaceae bacterium]